MNVRKPIDYREPFAAVDRAALPQMELYRESGIPSPELLGWGMKVPMK